MAETQIYLYEHFYIRLGYNGVVHDQRYDRLEWASREYINYNDIDFKIDKNGLLDKDFVNQLGYSNRFAQIYINRAYSAKEAIENIIDLIEDELG